MRIQRTLIRFLTIAALLSVTLLCSLSFLIKLDEWQYPDTRAVRYQMAVSPQGRIIVMDLSTGQTWERFGNAGDRVVEALATSVVDLGTPLNPRFPYAPKPEAEEKASTDEAIRKASAQYLQEHQDK